MIKYITNKEVDNIEVIFNDLKPGDKIFFNDEEFLLTKQITIKCNGTQELPIIIGGVDFEHRPLFDFSGQEYGVQTEPDCNGFRIIGENLIIQNMIIRYSGFKGIKLETKNTVVENIEVYGCCDSGIHIVSGGNNLIKNCDSHDNFGYKKSSNPNRTIPFGFSSDGISDKLHDGEPDTFIGCRSWNNTDDGFDFYARKCTNGENKLYNCWAFNNGKSSFNMISYPRYSVDKKWFDQFINGKKTEDAKGDKVHATLSDYPAFGNGNGFKLGGTLKENNISLYSCICIGNRGKGFDQNNNAGIMYLNGCYSANNGSVDYGFRMRMYGFATFEDCESNGKNNILCKHKEIGENRFNTGKLIKYTFNQLSAPRDKNGNLPKLN